jgi:hypothetical protein
VQEKLFRKVALDRLFSPDQLDQLMKITTPRGWMALLALIALAAAAVAWAFLGYIPVRVDGHGVLVKKDASSAATTTLEAVVFVPLSDIANIRPGQDVLILPVTVKPEEHGYLVGKVSSVGEEPATDDLKDTLFGSDALAQQFAPDALTVAVHVDLLPGDTPGRYKWSCDANADVKLPLRTPCSASMTIKTQHPITWWLP